MTGTGPLTEADETFTHQIADTFATVGQADRGWTEKVFAMAATRDGAVQLTCGLGKYANRNVMDAFGGVSRGVEQWTVRASRQLSPDWATTTVGPVRYEVLEPLRSVRFSLDSSEVSNAVPIRFEWVFTGAVPPALEERDVRRSPDGARLDNDLVRYHQTGTARGWVEIAGERIELDDASSVSQRDHSWGVRAGVGQPPADVPTRGIPDGVYTEVHWAPILCERADGSRYALHWFLQHTAFGAWSRTAFQGGVEHPDGRREPFVAVRPELRYRDDNRRLIGGQVHFTTADGGTRSVTVTPVSDTGFHLGTALYFGFDGHFHGEWRGPLHVDGEHFGDCSVPEVARRVHQMRDTVVRVEDPAGGGTGWGTAQVLAVGPNPALGLTAEASFL